MDTQTQILIALIAAGSAIFGALVTQLVTILQTHFDRRHKKNIFVRERYEQLANHVTNSMSWPVRAQNVKTLDELNSLTVPTDARQALTISSLYFSQLRQPCIDYLNSMVVFQQLLFDGFKYIPNVSAGAQAVMAHRAEFERAMGDIQLTRQILDNEIIRLATKFTKA